MPLSDVQIKAAKPQEKAYKLFDGRGLHLFVKPNGARLWRFKYTFGGREKLLSFGDYRDVPLRAARDKLDDARKLVAAGKDPSEERKKKKVENRNSFELVAADWLEKKRSKLSESAWNRDRDYLTRTLGPSMGKVPVSSTDELTARLLTVLKRLESAGRLDTAKRVRAVVGRVLRHASANGYSTRDISVELRDAVAAPTPNHLPGLTEPARVGALLRAIDGYDGQPATAIALKLAPYVFVRPVELRSAHWEHIDLEAGEWRIPADIMKMGEYHFVPLSRQAVNILRAMEPISGAGRYVFPAIGAGDRPISENTLNAALRRLGYNTKTEHCAHGFRTTASTLLNEQGFHPDLIELQLAHEERNKVRGAYNRAKRLAERREMMQTWADYLGKLKAANL